MHVGLPTRFSTGSGGSSNNNNIHIKLKAAAAQTNCLLKYNTYANVPHE
jgi:hypothetical protein